MFYLYKIPEMQTIYPDKKHVVNFLEIGGRGERRITKGPLETFMGNGYVHYFDFGDGFTGVYIFKNLSECILFKL